MLRFENINYLYLLWLIGLFILLFWLAARWRNRALLSLGEISLIQRLAPHHSKSKKVLKFIFIIGGFFFIIIGLANPQIGTKLEEIKRKGVDIIIALDVSNSMLAEDIKPHRLESAKLSIAHLIDELHEDRIGIIVFAGDAYTQLPLTADYAASRLFLNTINTDVVPVQGTAIGAAVKLAIKSFAKGEDKHKALIIITDGENHEDDAISETKNAVAEGIIVHTIGMGLPEGAPIPVYNNNLHTGFRKDKENKVVISQLNESMLQEIADLGKGKYIRATNRQDELSIILDEISMMEKKQFEAKIFTDYQDRFQYFIAIALLLLIIETIISERKSKWMRKIL